MHHKIVNKSLKNLQEKKMLELLTYLQSNSPFYQKKFAENKIDITVIKQLEDLASLPVTTKEDLQKYNNEFLCVPKNKIIEYTSTSGTLGAPVTVALTDNDLNRLAENEYQSFLCADGTASDIYQLMITLDRQFMAGMAYYSGVRKMGAGIIRLGPGVPSLQWDIINRLKPTAIVAVPSFIIKLIQYAAEHKIDINSSSVKKAICIGENIRNTDFSLNILGKKITDVWDIQLYSTYASTEMQTAFTECSAGMGGHQLPELVILEMLDENNQQVAPGEPGEVTITTLGIEGMPLLRYKTGDICTYFTEPCSCGRSSTRLSSVIGRKKQMIKFKGTTLYPPALFDILNEMEEVEDFVVEVFSNDMGTDELHIFIARLNNTEESDRKIRANMQARLRVSPNITYLTAPELHKIQITEAGRKVIRFIDKRL